LATNIEHDEAVDPLGGDLSQFSGNIPVQPSQENADWYTVGSKSAPMGTLSPTGATNAFAPSLSTNYPKTVIAPKPTQTRTASKQTSRTQRKRPSWRVIAIGVIAFILLCAYGVSALAKPAMSAYSQQNQATQIQSQTVTRSQGVPTHKVVTQPTAVVHPKPSPVATQPASTWFAGAQLPQSCAGAGVTSVQAVRANNEATAFTQREESIAFDQPNGLKSSINLMTDNAKNLRFVNDRRSTNAFAQELQNGPNNKGLIQIPGNFQPQLVNCQKQNGQLFVWEDVSFSLAIQCQTDGNGNPCQANPNFLPEMDQQTHQPKIHHMVVLLVAVPPGQQNAPLWLGWAVSDYMIDVSPGQVTVSDKP
jgi:hypothetical protein